MIVKATRTSCITGIRQEVMITVEKKYHEKLESWYCKIVEGGVTGYESIKYKDLEAIKGGWWACIGTKGKWDKLYVPSESLLRIKMMNYNLVTKFEEFTEKKGMINIYVCKSCNRIVVYGYEDEGVTPDIIICDKCGNEAHSQFLQITQPTRIWYRPKSLEEIEKIAEAAWAAGVDIIYRDANKNEMISTIFSSYIEHYNSGGLFARMV